MRAILTFHNIIVRGKVTGQRPQTTTFEEKGEPKRFRTEVPLLTSLTNALPLGQTGSRMEVGGKGDYTPIVTLKPLSWGFTAARGLSHLVPREA